MTGEPTHKKEMVPRTPAINCPPLCPIHLADSKRY